MSGLLKPEDYPTQEPVPAAPAAYRAEALKLGRGIEGIDCRYGENIYQRVALFVPKRPNGTVLMYMHGGGWTSGFKEVLAFMAPGLTAAGITFASAGYRLAPQNVFPAGFDDAADALAWVHAHVAEYGGNPSRIFVGGHSAGGHYASLLAVRRDWQASRGVPVDVIKGCTPVSGAYDLTSTSGMAIRPRFLGPEDSGCERDASPIFNIGASPPPFFMAHGSEDFPHLMRQAADMEKALAAAGGKVERMVLQGRTHFTASLATADTAMPWQARAIEWLGSN
jgi:arylformamidase